jgi:hypothetical protein
MRQTKLGADTVLVMFNFTDGTGDLGSKDNEPNFIEDGRDSFKDPTRFRIEPQGQRHRMITIACPRPAASIPTSTASNFRPVTVQKCAATTRYGVLPDLYR